MRRRRLTAASLAAIAVLGACAAQGQVASDPLTRTTAPIPSSVATRDPSVTLVRPGDGARFRAGSIELVADVRNFDVVRKQFQAPVVGEGHVHFYLDVDELPTTHTFPTTDDYRSVSRTTYIWRDVEPGEHKFSVQLVGNDHVPLNPPAKDEVRVTVD